MQALNAIKIYWRQHNLDPSALTIWDWDEQEELIRAIAPQLAGVANGWGELVLVKNGQISGFLPLGRFLDQMPQKLAEFIR
jgi:hypothetical protein